MCVGRQPGCLFASAHGTLTYSRVPQVEVFVPPYPQWTRPPVSVLCYTLWLCHNTYLASNTGPMGQSGLVALDIVLAAYSLRVLLCLLGFNGQRTCLVLEVVALRISYVTSSDCCNTCTLALFPAALAVTSLVIGDIVGFEVPEGLDHVSS